MTNKSDTLTKIVFCYPQSVKVRNKRRLDSPMLDICASTFRSIIHVLDIVQFVHRTTNCKNIIKILYELSTIHETLKTVKGRINISNISTYKNLCQDRAQNRNCSETQISPKILNKFIISG